MKKRGLGYLSLAFGILIINLVSAYGSYGYFGFGSFISSINPLEFGIVAAIFIIFFAIINLALSRSIFRNSPGLGNVVSAAVAFLIMGTLYKTGFSFTDIVYNLGFPTDALYPIFWIILITGIIYLWRKIGIGNILVLSAISIGLITVLTDWIYEKGAAGVVVFILAVLGLWLRRRRKKKIGGMPTSPISTYRDNSFNRSPDLSRRQRRIQRQRDREDTRRAQEEYYRGQEERIKEARMRAEEAAYKEESQRQKKIEEIRRQKDSQRLKLRSEMGDIAHEMENIKSRMSVLQQNFNRGRISVQERGQIEREMRNLSDRAKKLEREYYKLEKYYKKI